MSLLWLVAKKQGEGWALERIIKEPTKISAANRYAGEVGTAPGEVVGVWRLGEFPFRAFITSDGHAQHLPPEERTPR